MIFGRRRAYQRKLAVAEFDGICSAHAMVVRAKPEMILPEFLPFFLQSDMFMERAVEISVGSLSPTINWKTLRVQEFPLPPIEEQKRIAEILWAADEAIESYQRTRLYLRDCRNTLFFDAVSRSGWTEERTAELSSVPVTKGATPSKDVTNGTACVPFVKVYNLTFDGTLDFSIEPTFIQEETNNGFLKRSRTLPGDILVNIVGPPLGKISVASDDYPEWNINQAIARIRIEDIDMRRFFVSYFRTDRAQRWLDRQAKKTSGQKNLTLKTIQDFPVPRPPRKELKAILRKLDSVDKAMNFVAGQVSSLKRLQKTLVNLDWKHV